MTLQDIQQKYTLINIDGIDYKIAYDFNSIGNLLELYNCSFSELHKRISDIEVVGSLEQYIEFCHVGFLKYQPEFDIEILKNYRFYLFLFTKCCLEFMKCIAEPEEWGKTIFNGVKAVDDKPKVQKKKLDWIYRIFGIKHES